MDLVDCHWDKVKIIPDRQTEPIASLLRIQYPPTRVNSVQLLGCLPAGTCLAHDVCIASTSLVNNSGRYR